MSATQSKQQNSQATYDLMAKALYCLAENYQQPPSLAELAATCGLSEFHFQKQFTRWVGISPKRFSQYLSKEYIKALLHAGMKPLEAAYQAGLSGPGRLHELFVQTEAMTPAQARDLGKGLQVHYGFHDSPFGQYLLAATDRGICHLAFVDDSPAECVATLRDQWAAATLIENAGKTAGVHAKLFGTTRTTARVRLLLKGTNFQVQVWQALLKIPYGQVASYEELARLAGNPEATRASASAIARNNIAWLIPCHRVVRKIGESGQYRWGRDRKRIILGYEGATLAGRG